MSRSGKSEESPVRIWHQSFTDLDAFPAYRQTLQAHAERVTPSDSQVVLHGLRPGTYPAGVAPMDANRHAYIKHLHEQQVCDAAMAAERAGYDAFALGCFFDPGLRAARSVVDIPVVSLAETCMLVACSLGRKCAFISLNTFQQQETEELAVRYGIADRLAAVIPMTPAVSLFTLEEQESEAARAVRDGFADACRRGMDAGADVVIPGDGVLNEFLYRSGLLQMEGAVVMDAIGVLFHYAAFLARARSSLGLGISRREHYAKPSDSLVQHARGFLNLPEPAESTFSGRGGGSTRRTS